MARGVDISRTGGLLVRLPGHLVVARELKSLIWHHWRLKIRIFTAFTVVKYPTGRILATGEGIDTTVALLIFKKSAVTDVLSGYQSEAIEQNHAHHTHVGEVLALSLILTTST